LAEIEVEPDEAVAEAPGMETEPAEEAPAEETSPTAEAEPVKGETEATPEEE